MRARRRAWPGRAIAHGPSARPARGRWRVGGTTKGIPGPSAGRFRGHGGSRRRSYPPHRQRGALPTPAANVARRKAGGSRGAQHPPCQSAMFNIAWAGSRRVACREPAPAAGSGSPELATSVAWRAASAESSRAGRRTGGRQPPHTPGAPGRRVVQLPPGGRYGCSLVSVKKVAENASSSKPTTSPSGPKVKEVGPE